MVIRERTRSPAEQALQDFLDSTVTKGIFSAVSAGVSRDGAELWTACAGSRNGQIGGPAPGMADRFDLASLTKPYSASLALRLDEDEVLSLATPIGDLWPGVESPAARQPVSNLLRHRSRLRSWLPLYQLCETAHGVPATILERRWWDARVGTYSDLGYILWRFLVERALERPYSELLRESVTEPLGVGVGFLPPGRRTVTCTIDTAKEVELARELGIETELQPQPPRGAAQDGNTRFLGGISGHAGLFGTVADLLKLGEAWTTPDLLVEEKTLHQALEGPSRWRLGWSRRRVKGDAGPALSEASFGHTGFTGGSLWIDPGAPGASRGAALALLGHRCSPFSSLAPIRRQFHRLAVDLLTERA